MNILSPVDSIEATLKDSKIPMVCLNDTSFDIDFEQKMAQIVAIYEKKLSTKSSFEK